MKLFNNNTDTYVARDAAHCVLPYENDIIGEPYRKKDLGEWRADTRQLDATIAIMLDDGRGLTTKTIAEWIAENPNGGMLCSTEY